MEKLSKDSNKEGQSDISIPEVELRHWWHYDDVIMSAMASQITNPTIVYSSVYSGKENIKAPRHWPMNSRTNGQ